MKKLLLLVGAFLSLNAAQAQYYYFPGSGGNPGGLNTDAEYPVGGGLPTGWTTLFSATAATVTTPVWTPTATIPFAFNFNGAPVTDYKVSTSGVLTFTTSATTVPTDVNAALPSASIPDKSVMVWGLYGNAGDFIITKTFGTAPNRQHWISFNSYSQATATSAGFTYWSIVLEETTNRIHIVDQRSSGAAMTLTAGIQVNGTTAFQVSGSPNLNSLGLATADPTPVDNNFYTFVPGTQPNFDMTVTGINVPTYLILSQAPFNITGVIKNLGATPVTSFTLNYSINGGATVSAPITANIGNLGTYGFSHPTAWTPAATGNYTIDVWATNINGNADQVTTNDHMTKSVSVLAATAQRTVLHEVFTSSTCPPCLPGNANLKTITTANPGKSIDIKYQQDFPAPGNDQYQSTESIARRGYYAINSIPRMEVDGGWDGNANSYTTTLLNQARNKPALVSISGTHTVIGKTVTAQAIIDPMGNNLPSNNLAVFMVITEKRTVRNIRTNGETEFFDVMKKMMPNETGSNIAPLTGAPVTINQTYTFPAKALVIAPKGTFPDSVENFNNLDVTIFLQDKVTKEVFQAARSLRTNSPTGIAENTAAANVTLYPNPATSSAIKLDVNLENAENVEVTVVNAIGQVVSTVNKGKLTAGKNTLNLDLKGQTKGIYFVKVTIGNKVVTKTLSLSL